MAAYEGGNSGKRSWPELVGKDGEEAAKIIKQDNPKLEPVILPPSVKSQTLEYNFKRVRVYVDSNLRVTRVPVIG